MRLPVVNVSVGSEFSKPTLDKQCFGGAQFFVERRRLQRAPLREPRIGGIVYGEQETIGKPQRRPRLGYRHQDRYGNAGQRRPVVGDLRAGHQAQAARASPFVFPVVLRASFRANPKCNCPHNRTASADPAARRTPLPPIDGRCSTDLFLIRTKEVRRNTGNTESRMLLACVIDRTGHRTGNRGAP